VLKPRPNKHGRVPFTGFMGRINGECGFACSRSPRGDVDALAAFGREKLGLPAEPLPTTIVDAPRSREVVLPEGPYRIQAVPA
jgi:hypothetical protein